MDGMRITALALLVAGVLGLVYGNFSYTKETHEAKIGSLELSVKDRETVNIPIWAGIAAVVAGGGLLLGVIEALGMHFTNPSLKALLSYVVFIGVLLLRPKGLFAK